MSKPSRKRKEVLKLLAVDKRYSPQEAVRLVKETAKASFDEGVDVAVNLGIDTRKSEQQVRGTVQLPHGTGKTVRVLALGKGEALENAKKAGADHVGGEEVVKKILTGWLEFDRLVVAPDLMAEVGKAGKVLGPRGLMPNPKLGSVTPDLGRAVEAIKGGQIEFRVDKTGIIHAPLGRVSFKEEQLQENLDTLVKSIQRLKPSSAKGVYLCSMSISATMGPGIPVDVSSF